MKVVLISWIPLQSSPGLHGSHKGNERSQGKSAFLLCECSLLPPRTWCSVCALTCPGTCSPPLLFWVVHDVTWQHLWELQALSLLTCSVSSLCSGAGKGGGVKLFYFPFPSNTKNLLMKILVKSPKTSKLLKKNLEIKVIRNVYPTPCGFESICPLQRPYWLTSNIFPTCFIFTGLKSKSLEKKIPGFLCCP